MIASPALFLHPPRFPTRLSKALPLLLAPVCLVWSAVVEESEVESTLVGEGEDERARRESDEDEEAGDYGDEEEEEEGMEIDTEAGLRSDDYDDDEEDASPLVSEEEEASLSVHDEDDEERVSAAYAEETEGEYAPPAPSKRNKRPRIASSSAAARTLQLPLLLPTQPVCSQSCLLHLSRHPHRQDQAHLVHLLLLHVMMHSG